MINRLNVFIKYRYRNYLIEKTYKKYKRRKFILIGTPNHKNIGDQAIAYAEFKFLKDNFKNYDIIDVNIDEYFENKKILSKYILKDDIIILQGGGNLGNEYLIDENIRRDVIKSFKDNKIILFPQSMYFTNDAEGNKELEKSKAIYSANDKLILIARENTSFEIMKSEFNNKVILVPDIVMYLKESSESEKRSGALLCFRDDVEGMLSKSDHQLIKDMVLRYYNNINITDMKADNNIKGNERKKLIYDKMLQFKGHDIVVTDRLHGMIFAVITGTPCIAMSNYNHKVKGTFEWIKNFEYVKYTNNINDIPKLINELKEVKNLKYDNSIFKEYYKQISDFIQLD